MPMDARNANGFFLCMIRGDEDPNQEQSRTMVKRTHPDQRRRVGHHHTRISQAEKRQEQADAAGGGAPERSRDCQGHVFACRRRRHESRNSAPAQIDTMPRAVCHGT